MPAEHTLLERDSELSEVDRALQHASEAAGGVVLIEGAAGTGKSTLMAAACERARASGFTVLRARGSELEREFGFGVLRQLFHGVLAGGPASDREQLLSGAAGLAGKVLAPDSPPGGAASDSFATLHAIHWLTLNLAERAPVLIAADDAHWADVSSLRALSYLAGRISEAPVVLLVAFRPHEPEAPVEILDSLGAEQDALRLPLEALSEESVATLVRDRLPSAGPDLCAAFAEATAGNPFLLSELLTAAEAADMTAETDPVSVVREAALAPVGERVVRRTARAGEGAPALAAAMAVLGPEGPLARAAALARLDSGRAGEIAHHLRRIDVLAQEDPFVFVHPLVRRSILDALPVTERNALHLAAGRLLRDEGEPVESAAAQLATLPPSGSSEVADACLAAAGEAGSRAAPDEAVRWLERALAEEAPEPPRATILEQLGMARTAIRDVRGDRRSPAGLGAGRRTDGEAPGGSGARGGPGGLGTVGHVLGGARAEGRGPAQRQSRGRSRADRGAGGSHGLRPRARLGDRA